MRSLSSVNDHAGSDAVAAAAALGRFAGDERLAAIFKQMRDIVGVSQSEMARRLGTNVSTLLDFEAGAVSALPDWPETVRIVDRYAELSQVDPSPILSRLLQLQPMPAEPSAPRPIVPVKPTRAPVVQSLPPAAPPSVMQPQSVPPALVVARQRAAAGVAPLAVPRAVPTVAAPEAALYAPRAERPASASYPATPIIAPVDIDDDHAVGFDGRSRTRETTVRSARQSSSAAAENPDQVAARRRRRRRRTIAVVSPILLMALVFGSMLMAPRPYYKVAQFMPTAMATPLLAVLDMTLSQTAAVRDGLRWIELDDPRLRKGDRQTR